MDFNDSSEEAAFRAEARAWLEKTLGPPASRQTARSEGDGIAAAKAYQAKKAAAGYVGLTWRKEVGGRELPPIFQVIFGQEEQKFQAPVAPFGIGLGMCIPTVIAFHSPEKIKRYVGPALRGEEIWCQLFSEPMAGSDLAALRTTAQKKGDQWIVNGQKIWTSGAQFCDYGLLLARTDPDVPKHKGLTMYFLRMDTPGLEIKPIKQMSGSSTFNEVFFKDCEVPDAQRVGAVGEGWKVAMGLLGRERSAPLSRKPEVGELLDYVRQMTLENGPALNDDAVREKVADFYVRSEAIRFTRLRMLTSLSRGQTPGPEGSIMKLADVNRLQEMVSFAIDLLGPAGAINGSAEPVKNLFEDAFFFSTALRIAGGTDEIQRNIIAERVLGLPADNRIDKNIAFKDVPTARNRP